MTQNLINKWKSNNLEVNKASTIENIRNLEKLVNFEFPKDFKDFYLQIDGFVDFEWTPNMFTLYSLKRIEKEHSSFNEDDKNFIPICDYLIASHFLGYLKGEKGIYKDYNHTKKVCNNLSELLDLIELDSEKIY